MIVDGTWSLPQTISAGETLSSTGLMVRLFERGRLRVRIVARIRHSSSRVWSNVSKSIGTSVVSGGVTESDQLEIFEAWSNLEELEGVGIHRSL